MPLALTRRTGTIPATAESATSMSICIRVAVPPGLTDWPTTGTGSTNNESSDSPWPSMVIVVVAPMRKPWGEKLDIDGAAAVDKHAAKTMKIDGSNRIGR